MIYHLLQDTVFSTNKYYSYMIEMIFFWVSIVELFKKCITENTHLFVTQTLKIFRFINKLTTITKSIKENI